jgi:seryl-tRNA synthetase
MAAPKFTPSTRPTVVSTAPAGLSENLTRDAKPVEVIDFQARIDSELAALNQAVETYTNDSGKTEQAIVDAKREVSRIMAELNAAQQRLKDLENAGSSLDKYNAALEKAEGQFTKIAGLYVEQVQSEIIRGWFQRDVDVRSISNERKNDLKLHKRIVDLQGFKYVPPTNVERYLSDGRIVVRLNVQNINKRVDVIGEKFVALKEHIQLDQAAKR